MLETYLSNIKLVNSTLLFIPSLSSAWPRPKAKNKIHSRSETRFIRLTFCLTETIFPFLHCYVHICNFLRSEQCPVAALSTSPAHCHLLGKHTPYTPRNILSISQDKQKNPNTGRGQFVSLLQSPLHIYSGQEVMPEQYYFCICLYFIF